MMNDILVQNFTSVHSLENNIWNIRKFEILEKNICQKKNLALLAQKIGEQKIVKITKENTFFVCLPLGKASIIKTWLFGFGFCH